ncbi:hypothetical protein [Streptosporangium sp. NPDC023615]|uniref:hypothetical protein n=1 Tax=Streptosporangium sp. NPDC023615 TaxID=3154794 RepID=UPI00343F3365
MGAAGEAPDAGPVPGGARNPLRDRALSPASRWDTSSSRDLRRPAAGPRRRARPAIAVVRHPPAVPFPPVLAAATVVPVIAGILVGRGGATSRHPACRW